MAHGFRKIYAGSLIGRGLSTSMPSRKQVYYVSILILIYTYSFVPFETKTESLSLVIRSVFAVLLLLSLVRSSRFYKGMPYKLLFIVVGWIFFMGLISISYRFLIVSLASLVGFFWAVQIYSRHSSAGVYVSALIITLIIFLVVFCIQQVIYYGYGVVIPFHDIVYRGSEARVGEYYKLTRLSGVFIEPGTYSNYMYALYILLIQCSRNRHPWLGVMIGITMILSFSVWGIYVGSLVCARGIILLAQKRVTLGLVALMAVSFLLFNFLDDSVLSFVENKINLKSASGASKEEAYYQFSYAWISLVVFGEGFKSSFCMGCLSLQDAGLFLNLSVVFGILFSLYVVLNILAWSYRVGGLFDVIHVAPLFFSKLYYWDFLFWMIYFSSSIGLYLGVNGSRNIKGLFGGNDCLFVKIGGN